MRVLGIEFAGSRMFYVLIEMQEDGSLVVASANKLLIGETRSRESLIAFKDAVSILFNSTKPELLAIKAKPESGQMMAGAAALKMEGIILANSPCTVDFVSGARINACPATDAKLHAYLQPALKTAHAALRSD